MPYPTKPDAAYDYPTFQAGSPTTPLPANQVYNDLNERKTAIDETIDFLKVSLRSDNKISAGMVPAAAMAPDALVLIGGWEGRGVWVTARAYVQRDLVTVDNLTYLCLVDHTSGTFATDLAAAKWMLLPGAAANIPFTPTSTLSSTTVQAAIEELAADSALAYIAWVDTVTALEALTTRPNIVVVKGLWAVGDMGEGVYRWKAADTTEVDRFTSVSPTSGTAGRYLRFMTPDAGAHRLLGPSNYGTDAQREVVILDERYDGFPKGARVPGSKRMGFTINSTIDHAGSDNLASIKSRYSDDNGKTWLDGGTIFGGTGLDCYTNAVGVDANGLIHAYCRERNSGNKLHRTSRDWVNWGPIDTITEDEVTGGSGSFNIANFRVWGHLQANPNGPGLIGGGYWLDGAGNFEIYHLVTNAKGSELALVSIATAADPPAYNETAHCASSAKDRLAITRRNGMSSPAVFVSRDAGATWTNLGDMGIPVSGGWLPQRLDLRVFDDVLHFVLFMGNRRPGSVGDYDEPYLGPGVSVWYCPVETALTSVSGWKMGHSHTWTHDASNTTDSYCDAIYDPITGVTVIASYDQYATERAKAFCWAVSDLRAGPRTPDTPDYAQHFELGRAAYLAPRDIIGGEIVTLAAARTVTPNEHGKAFVATTTDAITLPLAADVSAEWFIEVKARGASSSVARAGSDTINGGTSLTLTDGDPGRRIRRASSTAFEAF